MYNIIRSPERVFVIFCENEDRHGDEFSHAILVVVEKGEERVMFEHMEAEELESFLADYPDRIVRASHSLCWECGGTPTTRQLVHLAVEKLLAELGYSQENLSDDRIQHKVEQAVFMITNTLPYPPTEE